jgi:CheY-like chemotaxis protein
MNVLVVGDQKDDRENLVALIAKLGRSITPFMASSVAEAIRVADDVQPKVILLDIAFDDDRDDNFAGLKVVNHVRNQPYGRDAYIIAVSGHALQYAQKKMREGGCDRVVRKPYDFDELLEIIIERPPSEAIKISASPATTSAAPPDELVKALHDLRKLILVDSGTSISVEDKKSTLRELKELIQALEARQNLDPNCH